MLKKKMWQISSMHLGCRALQISNSPWPCPESYIYAIPGYASDQPVLKSRGFVVDVFKQTTSRIAGLGNNPKSQERAFELGATLGSLLGCQVRLLDLINVVIIWFARWEFPMQLSYPSHFWIWSLNWYFHLFFCCQGGPGTLLSCFQEIEDGFDILDATDYGPYPNIDKV